MIVIIPARQGSKRIKKKNIKIFNGKPIIYWVIKELKKNNYIKKIVVTSDDTHILALAKKFGADYLIKRSKKLSGDKTPFQEAIKNAIHYLNIKREKVLVVFPCAVFLKNKYIFQALNVLSKHPQKFIISVGRFNHPIQRAYKIVRGKLKYFYKKFELYRTQDLADSYFDAGQFYLGYSNLWINKNVHSNSIGLALPKERIIDIDNLEDWKFAEKLSKFIK